ncbi:MAG: Smr/MutS family protein [Burkholderiales bacterium]|nr:Smr/MutS family protein [Burkholderiales bacterium]
MAKLSDLKDLLATARTRTPAPSAPEAPAEPAAAKAPATATASRRAIAAGKHGDGDIDLRQAFADVQRLPPANRATVHRPRPAPIPLHTLADERDVLQASKYGDDPAPHSWDIGQEFEHEQNFVRKGLPPDLLTKLRRGHWSVQAELDLHGMIVNEAHDALADFIVASRARRLRCVRIIHGKGLTSPGKEPVLKGKVRRWLAHWDEVLAFTEAPQHAGGGGAVIALLKGGVRT